MHNAGAASIQRNFETHSRMLIDEFNRYFHEYTEEAKVDQQLIRNLFEHGRWGSY